MPERLIKPVRLILTWLLAVATTAAVVVGTTAAPASAHNRRCANGYVGLTFDDGPSAATTDALLAALRAGHARATFFNIGANEEALPDLVRKEARAGMWVGNHSWSHPNLPEIGEPAAFQELLRTQVITKQILHRWPTLFRPPFGATSDQVRADARRLHLLEVLWTVDSRDWAGASAEEIVAAAATMKNRDIILMHDWPANTVTALPQILRDLAARGLCPGRIAYTPDDISGVGQIYHAIAVRP